MSNGAGAAAYIITNDLKGLPVSLRGLVILCMIVFLLAFILIVIIKYGLKW